MALVLSGGGAKGVAHIGVIKALEEARIPIDYITGTSMGAIIGGLYASGYTVEEMETILKSEEFKVWISGKIDPRYIYFFRQPYPDASWITFRFRVDSVIQSRIPANLVSPESMDFALLELFSGAGAAAGYNFDSLMVPFRCVAADIQESKPVVLRSGDLPTSIRASMTFPFYFRPVRINNRLLFDGGMYNNFPADVALEDFSPDIIIGSKAAIEPDPPAEDDITSQLQNMITERTNYDVICQNSVLIEPWVKQVNVIDFSHSDAFIDSGYVAAKRKIDEIRQFVLDSVSPEQRALTRARFNVKKPPYLIRQYSFEGMNKGQYQFVQNILRSQQRKLRRAGLLIRGDSLSLVKKEYFRMISEGRLQHLYPALTFQPELDAYSLHIKADCQDKFFACFGGNISSKATNEAFLQLEYHYWSKLSASISVNAYVGRFYNSANVSGRLEFPTRVPFYLDLAYVNNQYNYQHTTNTYFFDYSEPVYLKQHENFFEAGLGNPIGNKGRFLVGFQAGSIRYRYYQTNTFTSRDILDDSWFEYIMPGVSFEFNSLNRKQYASHGSRFFAGVSFVSGTEEHDPGSTALLQKEFSSRHNYFKVQVCYLKYLRQRGIYTLGFSTRSVISFQSLFDNYTASLLVSPAYTPVPEMTTLFQARYRNPVYSAAGIHHIFTLLKNFDLRLEGFAMVPYRNILQQPDRTAKFGREFKSLKLTGSASVVYQSPIGPLSIGVNYFDREEKPFSFSVNIGYILFNRPALN